MELKNNYRQFRIGEVYLMKFSGIGNEQTGWRPGLVFQNNMGNEHSPNIIALPFTTCMKKLNQPTHVVVKSADSGLLKDSLLLCENPQRMAKESIGEYISTLSQDYMGQIAAASLVATSAISFMDLKTLLLTWQKATALNNTLLS